MAKKQQEVSEPARVAPDVPADVIGGAESLHVGLFKVPCREGFRLVALELSAEDLFALGLQVAHDNGGILRGRIARHYGIPL